MRNGHTNGNGTATAPCKTTASRTAARDGILGSRPPRWPTAQAPRNFEEFIYKVWGAGIAKHFAIPYNRKLWAVPLSEMETSWLGGRVPLPDLEEMIEGALCPCRSRWVPTPASVIPCAAVSRRLMDGFLPHLAGRSALGCRVSRVSPARQRLTLSNGRRSPTSS